jgi:hypothetical protein
MWRDSRRIVPENQWPFLATGSGLSRGFPARSAPFTVSVFFLFGFCDLGSGDRDGQLRSHVSVDANGDFVRTGLLDRTLEFHGVLGELETGELDLQAIVDVLRGDGTKGFAGFTCLEVKSEFELVDFAGDFFSCGDFAGFTLGTLGLEVIHATQGGSVQLKSGSTRNEKVASVTTANLDDVSFGSEVWDVFREKNFCICHKILNCGGRMRLCGWSSMSTFISRKIAGIAQSAAL